MSGAETGAPGSSGGPGGAGLRLRRAVPADVPRLAEIDAASPGGGWSEPSFEQELGLAWSRTVVAEDERGAVVGFAVYWLAAGEAELLNIAVAAEARRRGIAQRLVAELVSSARAVGAEWVLLEVRRGNEAARSLYARLGFVENGVRPGYYGPDGEDAVLMELRLV